MLNGRVSGSVYFLRSYTQLNVQEAFAVNTVPADDPTWLRHLVQHAEHDDPVMFEGSRMTDDAFDLVSRVGLPLDQPGYVLTSWICLASPKMPKCSYVRYIGNQATSLLPFFDTMYVLFVPHVCLHLLTQFLAIGIVLHRDRLHLHGCLISFQPAPLAYDVVDDPFPGFTFRVATRSVSAASKHRQQIFRTLDGCAPLISWDRVMDRLLFVYLRVK
jgi:hypothetical protein